MTNAASPCRPLAAARGGVLMRLALALVLGLLTWAGLTSTASARVPRHIPTWAFDDGCSGGATAGAGLVRGWVTYAESNCGVTAHKARQDCHGGRRSYCDVMQYLDTDWLYPGDHVLSVTSASVSSWWLTEPSPHQASRIFSASYGGGYLADQNLSSVQAFFRGFVRRYYNRDDGLLMDWQSPSLFQELYYSTCGCRSTAQIHTDGQLRASHQAMARAVTHANGSHFIQADNTLPGNPFEPQGLNMLNRRIGVDAWTVEGEPMNDGSLTGYYSTLLDQMAYIVTRTHAFIAPLSRAPAGASYLNASRLVQEATMLLAFKPGQVVDWADLEQGSNRLAVWPEEGIYPTRPVESMGRPGGRGCLAGTGQVCTRGGHRSLEVAPDVYRREFRACYRDGAPIGPCATIMNASDNYVTVRGSWLRQSYGHEMTLIGGDVQSGGYVNVDGTGFAPGSSLVAPKDAILISR